MDHLLLSQDRIRAALDAYSMIVAERAGQTFTNGDHHRAIEAALDAADQLGGPYLARVTQVERKLANLRAIATAAKSQAIMVLSELGNVERAVGRLRPGATPSCPTGCGPTDRLPNAGSGEVVGYRCPNCQTTVSIVGDVDPALQPVKSLSMSDCTCVVSCADDPDTACSLSGINHVHPDSGDGLFGPCPLHPDAPGDL